MLDRLKLHPKIIFLFLFGVVIIAVLFLIWKRQLPELKSHLAQVISYEVYKLSQIEPTIEDVHFGLFPLHIGLSNIELINRNPSLQPIFLSAKIGYLSIDLSYHSLFKGRLAVGEILFRGIKIKTHLDKIPKSNLPDGIDLSGLFSITPFLDGSRIVITESELHLVGIPKAEDLEVRLLGLDLLADVQKDQLNLGLHAPRLETFVNSEAYLSPVSIQIDSVINPNQIRVNEFSADTSGLKLKAEALIKNLPTFYLDPWVQFDISSQVTSEDLETKTRQMLLGAKGFLHLDAQGLYTKQGPEEGSFRIKTSDFGLKNYNLGDATISADVHSSHIQLKELSIQQKGTFITARNSRLNYQITPFAIDLSSDIEIERLNLLELFKSLNLAAVPVDLTVTGSASCQGPLYPGFKLDCSANAKGENLKVAPNSQFNSLIVGLPEFTAVGKVTVTTQSVSYQSKIELAGGQGSGTSNGVVDFNKGFEVLYQGQNLPLSLISPIANLDFSGSTQVSGVVQGNRETATFLMDLTSEPFSFEKMNFGKTSTQLAYRSGILYFNDLKSQLKQTEISGSLQINLLQERLLIELSTQGLKGEDLSDVFKNYLPENFISQGDGKLKLNIRGPYNWRSWNTQIELALNKPLILNEYFDELRVQLITQDNFIQIGNSYAAKGPYRLTLSGQGNLKQDALITLRGQGLPLEYIDNLSLLGASLSGFAGIQAELKAPFGEYAFSTRLELSDLYLNEQDLPNLIATYRRNAERDMVNLQYGSDIVLLQTQIPRSPSELASFKLTANKLDTRPFFALIGSASLVDDYSSSLSSEIQYEFVKSDPFSGSGYIQIDNLQIARQGLSLSLVRPAKIDVQTGVFKFEEVRLEGSPDQSIVFAAEGEMKNNLRIIFNPDIELSLLHPFFPFLDDFRGRARGNLIILGLPFDPMIYGQAHIQSGQVQFKNLNPSFSQVQVSAQFKDKELNILNITGELGQGQIQGRGNLRYNGFGNIEVNVPLSIRNSVIDAMEGVRVKAQGNATLKGNWFPYLVEGELIAIEGLISKDFESAEAITVRRSSLLPKVILRSAVEPILLKMTARTSSPINIRNNLIDGSVTGNLSISGYPSQPSIKGDIRVTENSKILFREHEFRVEQGLIQLDGNIEINPALFIAANARIDRYDVALGVQGTVNSPLVRLSSQPVLPEQDLVSLLALGQLVTDVERGLQTPSSQTQAETQIGSVLLQNIPLFKKAQKAAGVSVQISSAFDPEQNTEFKKISVSKKINERTKVVAATGDYGFREFKLEYALTDNFSAIGRFKQQDYLGNGVGLDKQNRSESILGLDLEYRREFR